MKKTIVCLLVCLFVIVLQCNAQKYLVTAVKGKIEYYADGKMKNLNKGMRIDDNTIVKVNYNSSFTVAETSAGRKVYEIKKVGRSALVNMIKAETSGVEKFGKQYANYISKKVLGDAKMNTVHSDPATVKRDSDQVVRQTQDEDIKVYDVVEQMPQFEGGDSVMIAWLDEHINYPKIAKFRKIEGRVVVRFVVEKDGSIGEIQLARSIDPWLDQEAMRVVKSMPKWIPGKQNGNPVRVWYTLPVNFKLKP